jgi:hypothetical protein
MRAVPELGALGFGWTVAAVPLLVVLAWSYWRFVLALPARTRRRFVTAGAIFVGAAVGIELIQGPLEAMEGTKTLRYAVLGIVEEFCEMLALGLFLSATLAHLQSVAPVVQVRIAGGAPAGEPSGAARERPARLQWKSHMWYSHIHAWRLRGAQEGERRDPRARPPRGPSAPRL